MKQSVKQDEKDIPSKTVLSESATGASYLILLQLFTRLLTFTFNQLILRHTTPSIFGFATIQLELLSSTILFLSREGFRIALQRDRGEIQRTVNLAYIPFVVGVVAGIVGCFAFWHGADDSVRELGGFGWGIVLYGIATVLELFVEPCFAVAQQMLLFRIRTLAEGFAVVVRCAVTFVTTIYFSKQGRLEGYGALPFGFGQLAYAVVLAAVYLFAISKRVNLLPQRIQTDTGAYLFHRPTLWLAVSVTGQSLFKHLLTEGDKLVLTFLTTPYTQGIYAVVSNYGSLIARILFQPLEETLRTILSNLLSPPTKQSLQQSFTLITTLLKLYILLAVIIHTLVPPLMNPVILPILGSLIGRDRFPKNALEPILYAYLYYIPIMAVNGVTESFIASVATSRDLARQSRAMVFFSIIFLASSWGLLRMCGMGGEGLVWANCINLGVRIIWSCGFMRTWFGSKEVNVQWSRVLPSRGTLVCAAVIGLGMRAVIREVGGWFATVGLLGISGLILVGSMAYLERDFLKAAYGMMASREKAE